VLEEINILRFKGLLAWLAVIAWKFECTLRDLLISVIVDVCTALWIAIEFMFSWIGLRVNVAPITTHTESLYEQIPFRVWFGTTERLGFR
jgi:hypothetical protein